MSDSPFIVTVTEDSFMSAIVEQSQTTPVLVDFWADWCAPCKNLMPVLESLAVKGNGRFILAKVNADEEPGLTAQFGVRSLPTVALIKDGAVVGHFQGAKSESEVKTFLDEHLGPAAPDLSLQVEALWATQSYEDALALLQQQLHNQPDDADAVALLLHTLLKSGALEEASAVAEQLNDEQQAHPAIKSACQEIALQHKAAAYGDVDLLEASYANDPSPASAHALAMALAAHSDYERAFELLLGVLRADISWNNNQGRQDIQALFQACTDKALVAKYQRKLMTLLF
ncbi:MAG: tetratricopeptide repeat protein [Natronospirillum sp.]